MRILLSLCLILSGSTSFATLVVQPRMPIANAVSHQFLTSISASGATTLAQPAFTDISGTASAAQLPNPGASSIGGVQSFAAVSNQFLTQISTSGVVSAAQPSFSNISGTATTSQVPTVTTFGVTSTTPLVAWAVYTATGAGNCTLNSQGGSWVSSVTGNAAGDCTLNFSGIWSSSPYCVANFLVGDGNQGDLYSTRIFSVGTTTVRILGQVIVNTSPVSNANPVGVICIGAR